MAGQPHGDVMPVIGKTRLCLDGARVAGIIDTAGLGVGIVEGLDEAGAKLPRFRRLIVQHLGHIAAPILVVAAIAEHADGMGRAQRCGEVGGIAEIIRPARGQARLGGACAGKADKAKQQGMKTLLIHARTFARLGHRLKGAGAALRIITIDDLGAAHDAFSNERLGELPPIDLAFGNTDAFFSPGMQAFLVAILKSPALDWFQSSAAGVEHPALVMVGQKARVYTANHTQSEAIAEWALWQALDFLRDGPGHRAQQAAADWQRRPARELAGTRWLVIGYGTIGEATGRRVTALGGRVTGVRRRPGPAGSAARIIGPAAIPEELGRADIVLLCLPHTRESENMANKAFFGAMAPDALFMNVGRGALVDEAALIAGLEAGKPAFAALDVTHAEPLPAANALWRHPKVALTPHDSAHTAGSTARADETFLANLDLYLKGEPLMNVVPASAFAGNAL